MQTPAPTNYKIKRNTVGQLRVVFKCPACQSDLQAALKDAGVPHPCPDCNVPHTVPGIREREEEREKERTAEMAKASGQAAKEAEARRIRLENEQAVAAEELERMKHQSALSFRQETHRRAEKDLVKRSPATGSLIVSAFLFALLGTLFLYFAISMKTSVTSSTESWREINNIGLLNDRLCWLIAGFACWIISIICAVGRVVGTEINQSARDISIQLMIKDRQEANA